MPDNALKYWDMYFRASDNIDRIKDGVCRLIPPSEWKAWFELLAYVVWPSEYAILTAMDRAYCKSINKMFAEDRARAEEEAKRKR